MDGNITSTAVRSNNPYKPTPMSIHQYDIKLAQAFHVDCEKLLQQFQEKQNLSFTAFCQLWKETRFVAIFKGLENILGIQIFIENCFTITKKFLYSSDLYSQTGALYVLYGLYYKQPIKEWVKVRLTQTDLKKIEEILDVHKSSHLLEPVFVFTKMRIDGAFHYCAVPQPLGIEVQHLKRLDSVADLSRESESSKTGNESVLNRFKNLMEADPDLVQFEETDEEYQRLAQKYKDHLYVFPSAIGEHLKDSYSQLFDVSLDDQLDSPTKLDSVSPVKAKAVSSTNAVYRGERKVVTALDLKKFEKPSTSQ